MRAVYLESERLCFEPLTTAHLSTDYVNWLNDDEVNRYLETGGDYTLDKLKEFLVEQENKDILFWAILKKGTNKHIGNIKIDPIDLISNSGEYGIMMGDKNEWGKGYAKEASLTIIRYCFDVLKLKKITLGVIEENINAVKLYEKLGFRIYDKLEGFGKYGNKKRDSLRMELNNDK